MKKIRIIQLLFILFINICLVCNSSNDKVKNVLNNSPCDNSNKINNLLKEIVKIKKIYSKSDAEFVDTVKTKYLVSNEFIKPGSKFDGAYNDTIISIEKNSLNINLLNRLYIIDTQFNKDSTSVTLKVEYYPKGMKLNRISNMGYSFDSVNCMWLMNKFNVLEY